MRATIRHRSAIAAVVLSLSVSGSVVAQPDQMVLQEEPDGTYSSDEGAFVAHVDRDGSVSLENKPPLQLQGLGASFDLTDIAMRIGGMDPYASAKLHYLDQTRDARAAMGARYRDAQLAVAPDLMRNNIEAALATVHDPRGRKQALFELWDECAETGEPALVAAGEAARVALLDFIQHEMTGPDAYTPAEIRAFNARRTSRVAFEPYDRLRPDARYVMAGDAAH
jgi:hypothetical protein